MGLRKMIAFVFVLLISLSGAGWMDGQDGRDGGFSGIAVFQVGGVSGWRHFRMAAFQLLSLNFQFLFISLSDIHIITLRKTVEA